ncbi:hypothetical protein Y027_5740 [Burkholderia pseudomallei TSV5]|nr:hypothetical protein Y027_5740 [Burkholderia pseudomallei TSV5]
MVPPNAVLFPSTRASRGPRGAGAANAGARVRRMLARAVRAGDGREGSLPDGRRARDTAARMAGIARSLAAGVRRAALLRRGAVRTRGEEKIVC